MYNYMLCQNLSRSLMIKRCTKQAFIYCDLYHGDIMFQCEIGHTVCSITPAVYLSLVKKFMWKLRLKYPFP